MDEPSNPIDRFVEWFPPEEWAEDYQEFVNEFAEQYEDAVERPYNEDYQSLVQADGVKLVITLAKRFLAEAGNDLVQAFKRDHPETSAEDLNILKSIAKFDPSVYEVLQAKPGSHYVLLDLLGGGDPIEIPHERMAEGDYFQWDLLLGRMIKHRDELGLTYPALVLPREYLDDVAGMFREIRTGLKEDHPDLPEKKLTPVAKFHIEEVMLNTWLYDAAESAQVTPKLSNLDGDDIELTALAYPIKGDSSAVSKALTGAEDFVQQDASGWDWVQNTRGDKVIHANLRIEGDRLLAECNSGKRAKRLTARLEKLVGSRLGRPLKLKSSIERELSMPRAPEPSPFAGLLPGDREALIGHMATHLLDHYRKELDRVVPMLEGKPRRLVRTEQGRRKVVNWLKFLENQHARQGPPAELGPMAPIDLTPIWSELDLLAYRNEPKSLLD